jgi:hypothetical protein
MDSLSLKENTEYEIIFGKLQLDVDRKKCVALYNFNLNVNKLINDYNQARHCIFRMEKRFPKPKG